jgi:microcystin-dependent protein
MAQPYIGEIKMVGFNCPPKGWAFCNGQILAIAQNQALFAILGTTYGGNGQTTFALPNLQGRAPVYVGQGLVLGGSAGELNHTLIVTEMPAHTHVPVGAPAATVADPTGLLCGKGTSKNFYATTANTPLNPASVGLTGGSQPHNNLQPYLVINFCIALVGVFPSRN